MPTAEGLNAISRAVLGAAVEVHKGCGPGLLESAYHECLAYELASRDLAFESQKKIPLVYKDAMLDCGFRVDFLVQQSVVVEVKAIDHFDRVHTAQVLTYLRLTKCHLGLLINFNVKVLSDGIRRVVLNFPEVQSVDITAAGRSDEQDSGHPLKGERTAKLSRRFSW
jgi:GxxExxY protein